MIENREKEWQQLQSNASQILDNPKLLPIDEKTKNFIPILHLWISPTFTPEKHWIFYKPQSQINPQPKPLIKQVIWKKTEDFKRLNEPLVGIKEGFHLEPTFEIKLAEIELEKLIKIIVNLAKISLPPFIKDEILGLDGEHFGIETLGNYHNARVIWWSSFPKEWKELINWFEKKRIFLEEKFSEN
ncbi:MAG: hypothetical protein K1X72_22105 [Pyrinomonadaceae bacterium]|nr:hypothetical protein [Pyrinomonadaceae bacterium]